MKLFDGKTVLVTGSCGSVGAEIVNQLVDGPTEKIVCVDNNETELFFQLERYRGSGKVVAHLADVRDLESLKLRMSGVNIVLHAAALKHVGLCEDSPAQAVATNIYGTQNVIDAAIHNGVERVIFTSSDKAVNPTNVMGTSKLMGERLMAAAAQAGIARRPSASDKRKTIFASTRFGNVLGSRGSVVPLFRRQIENGGPLTLTDRRMSRFVMTLEESVRLVLDSVWLARGGEVMVTKMPVAMISDLAEVMIEALSPGVSVGVEEIGSKPGEKLYEELMNDEEVRRTWDCGDFFVVLSPFDDPEISKYPYLADASEAPRAYCSDKEKPMSKEELRKYLSDFNII